MLVLNGERTHPGRVRALPLTPGTRPVGMNSVCRLVSYTSGACPLAPVVFSTSHGHACLYRYAGNTDVRGAERVVVREIGTSDAVFGRIIGAPPISSKHPFYNQCIHSSIHLFRAKLLAWKCLSLS